MGKTVPAAQDSVLAQADAFRLADRDGFDIALLAYRTKISKSTLRGWASGRTVMPVWAVGALLAKGFPVEHMNVILEPFQFHIAADEAGEGAWDEAAEDALALAAAVGRARAERGPGKPAIVPQERAELASLARRSASSARRAARDI